jgi:hypothetical protein
MSSHLPDTFPLPRSFARRLTETMIRSLPRPEPDAPDEDGLEAVFEAVGLVALYAPRDGIEARLVQQIVVAHVRGPLATEMAAARQGTPALMLRFERHGMAQERTAARLERRLAAHRRDRAGDGAEAGTWACDLAAMEAVWRGVKVPEVEMPAAAVVPEPPRVPLWKQNKRRWMHEITDEELDELSEAEDRGEPLEAPPNRPGIRH